MSTIDLLSPWPEDDRPRIRTVLADLAYYARGRYSLVGGLPIRYYLMKEGISVPERPFNDIDLVAEGPEAFHYALVEHFLIHHFHDGSLGRDFRFVLIHKETNTKVDVFHEMALNGTVGGAPLGRSRVPIQSLESQLAKTIFDLHTMHHRAPIDPKQFEDADAMIGVCDEPLVEKMWRQQMPDGPTVWDAYISAAKRAAGNPETVGAKPWQSKPPYQCAKCYPTNSDWPLASMDEVYERLGYIELDGDNML